jgi:hypothetical protein
MGISELETLHKILNDKTRRKIILLLNEKGNLSYTDLKTILGITNNGRLNFHLKALNDLLIKDENGQYLLTERGNHAAKLLSASAEHESLLLTRKKGWKRLFILIIASNSVALIVLLLLTLLGYIDFLIMMRGIFGFVTSTVGLSIVYKMIGPASKKQAHKGQIRTIQDIFVAGRYPQEVNEEVQRWINDEGIIVEMKREDFVRGRLGAQSGLALSVPKYFEVSFKPDKNGVIVHTEGWINAFDLGEKSFSKSALAYAGVPRRKGWVVIEHLWKRLKMLSR